MYECYPKTITAVAIELWYTKRNYKISISFYYRNWSNLSIDEVRNYTVSGEALRNLPLSTNMEHLENY